MAEPEFDVTSAHKFLSANCFNRAWDLIDQADRTCADDEQMLLLSYASLWHWTQRPDCTPAKKAIGYWQLSRINAILDRADESRRHAQSSLTNSGGEPFLVGYAYEALARAEAVAGNHVKSKEYLAMAQRHAKSVTSAEDRELLLRDLDSLA